MTVAEHRFRLTVPTIYLCVFLLLTQVARAFYLSRGVEPSLAFEYINNYGLLWLMVWWLKEDNKRYRIGWLPQLDLGLFLSMIWMLFLPYYLFKTRGGKALITILLFAAILVGTYLIALILFLLLAP